MKQVSTGAAIENSYELANFLAAVGEKEVTFTGSGRYYVVMSAWERDGEMFLKLGQHGGLQASDLSDMLLRLNNHPVWAVDLDDTRRRLFYPTGENRAKFSLEG